MSTSTSISALGSAFAMVVALGQPGLARQGDVFDRVTHGQAVSEGGVKIHYATLGQGPLVDNLVILNLPHPSGLARELRSNPEQIKNCEYALTFQRLPPADPTVFFGRPMTAETLSAWVKDPVARRRYVEAFAQSDFEGMLNYYKRNYPRAAGPDEPPPAELPRVTMPMLMFHGLDDRALHADGLSGTWKWLDKDLTLVTVPGAGHFVQQDAADLVTNTVQWWLTMRTGR